MDSQEIILFNKEGFTFSRVKKNKYKLQFSIENNNINISKIIDFNLVKLIYDLNPDIYEKINIKILNDFEAIATLLMKPFFEDLGLPQKFSFLHIKKIVEERKIIFKSTSIKDFRPENLPDDVEQMAIEDLTSVCDIITPHKVYFTFNIIFNDSMNIPQMVEKMVGLILFKIFKRVKQFIENVRI